MTGLDSEGAWRGFDVQSVFIFISEVRCRARGRRPRGLCGGKKYLAYLKSLVRKGRKVAT